MSTKASPSPIFSTMRALAAQTRRECNKEVQALKESARMNLQISGKQTR
jgi:hypothetical protein